MTYLGLALLAGVSMIVGRLVARVSRLRWLDRFHPDVLPVQAALGTAALTSLCATSSHAGLGQRRALVVVALACLGLLAWSLAGRGARPRRPPLRWWAWIPLALALGAAATVGLLPIVRFHSFSPFNDAFYYDAASDWLVDHGVSELAPRMSDQPALACVGDFQEKGVRLGTSYLQAGLTALVGASHALLLFYAVSCWGFILLAGCLYSLARAAFRLPPWLAAAAVCMAVCVPAGASHALEAGFQAQLYGLAALVTLLCFSARMLSVGHRTAAAFVLLGLLVAWQASAYSELLPVTGAVLAVWLLVAARRPSRARAPRAWAWGLATFAAACVLLGNLELVRASIALPLQASAVVGYHIDLPASSWLGVFSGCAVYPPLEGLDAPLNPLALVLGPIVPLALCLVGLARRRTRRLASGTATAIAVLALLVVYFAGFRDDPWTHDRPHTWSLLKLSEWLQPLIVVGAWAGASRWLASRGARRVAAAFALLLVLAGLPAHVFYASTLAFWPMRVFSGSDRPLDELEGLCAKMAEVSRRPMYVVTRPHLTDPSFVELLGYLTIRGRAAGLWDGCNYIYTPWVPWLAPEKTDRVPIEPDAVLLVHAPHFAIPGSMPLGCQVVAAPMPAAPVLCQVANANGLQTSEKGNPLLWIGGPPTTLVVFAPRDGRLRLDFLAHLGPDDWTTRRQLEVTSLGRTELLTIDTQLPRTQVVASLRCDVVAGVNEILVRCTDHEDPDEPARPDGRLLKLAFSQPRLSFDEPGPSGIR
jgi:hypothetical protein